MQWQALFFSKLGENEISLNNIVKIVKNEGWISEINMNAYQKKKFETDELEIIEAIKQLDILEMNSAKNILQSNLKNINK